MKRFGFYLLAGLLTAGLVACGGESGGTNNTTCNNDGTCDSPTENAQNCPADCSVSCDLNGITGTANDYLISSLRIPISSQEAQTIGVDIDGDGQIDNKLGQIMALFASQGEDPNISINQGITDGDLLLLGRVYVDAFPTDDVVLTQLFQGDAVNPVPPAFDGNDTLSIAAGFPTDIFLCGTLNNGAMAAGPGNLSLQFPLPGGVLIDLTIVSAQMNGPITATTWTDVMVGGGVTNDEIQNEIVPAVADFINTEIAGDPTGSTATTIMGLFDDQCNTTVPGCENAGAPDCAANDPSDPTQDPWVTATEIRCNALFDAATQPDVDSDGDGTNDLLSLGLQVQAVGATIQ